MRVSGILTKTLREDPSEAETASHRLMLRAGMIQQVSAGIYAYLPLALRSLRKIEQIIRDEMDAAGGQEVRMPVLHPLELWQTTGRDHTVGPILFKLNDRRARPLILAPTHEEAATNIVKANTASYRDLPRIVYQIQTKFRDEPRPRAGLLRGREFDMKDAYSFDTDDAGLDVSYQRMMEAYWNVFRRCGLPTLKVEADSGAIGGKDSHEFIMPAESGEDLILSCPNGDYAANVERARAVPQPASEDEPTTLSAVDTPGLTTIAGLAEFLGIPATQALKAVFYNADGQTVLVTIRGDLSVNEVKLRNHLHVTDLRMATDEESRVAGLTPGSTSPIGVKGVRTIGDESICQGTNFAAGANQLDKHFIGANYPRDFAVDEVVDIAEAQEGQGCPMCGAPLEATRGIEVGHVFKLGAFYSEALGATYLNDAGQQRPIVMGCYGIGVTRVLAAAIEQNHDAAGIIFPAPIAPYDVHLVALNTDDPDITAAAENLYKQLLSSGFEVLYDDRVESPGVKFKDADLLGMPIRLVFSRRNFGEGAVEFHRRRDGRSWQVPLIDVSSTVREQLARDRL